MLALVALPATLLRAQDIGWLPIMTLQLAAGVLTLLVNISLASLSVRLKTGLLLLAMWSIGIGGVVSLGMLAVGIWFMAFAAVMSAVLFSLRAGIASALLGVVVLALSAVAFTRGALTLSVDPAAFVVLPSAWITYIAGFGIVLIVLLVTMAYYRDSLLELLRTIGEQRDTIEKLATHDALTGLPALRLANDRLDMALRSARHHRQSFALMFIDLDGFKAINDSHGHHVGDSTLSEIARRLSGCVASEDTVARVGGDEFLVLLAPPTDASKAAAVAQRMRDALSEPIRHRALVLSVGASIGVAMFPDDGENAEVLKVQADRAMYRIKAGRSDRPDQVRAVSQVGRAG